MSIRRPRGPKPTLKHLAFLEAMNNHASQSAEYRALYASWLTLRLFDAWSTLGSLVADDDAPAFVATRSTVAAASEDHDLQLALSRIIEGIHTLREPDVAAVLPRVAALGALYAERGAAVLAADVEALVLHHSVAAAAGAATAKETAA